MRRLKAKLTADDLIDVLPMQGHQEADLKICSSRWRSTRETSCMYQVGTGHLCHEAIINQVSHELSKLGSNSCVLESGLGDPKWFDLYVLTFGIRTS
jgi:hypothetical protein